MGTNTVDQAKLVLNTFVTELENQLVSGKVLSWNQHDGEMDDTNRLQVVEQFGPRYNVTRTEGGVKDLSGGTDGSVFGSEIFAITGTFNANMGWADFVKIRDIGTARENKALQGAITSMAHKIDAYNLGAAALASHDWTGTPGNNVTQSLDANAGYTRLKENGVIDGNICHVMNYTDEMLLGDQIIRLQAMGEEGSDTYRNGFSGRIGSVPTVFTNQLPVLTTGTRAATGAAAVVGANNAVNYADVAVQTTANGLYMTQLLPVNGLAAGATVKAGEVFTLPGVFAWDNRKQALVQPARLLQFTVIADATADGTGAASLRIFPAIIVPGVSSGDASNANINIAHSTASAVPAAGALLTFIGAPGANLAPRLTIDKDAVVINTVPLILPASDTSMRRNLKTIPLSVRLWMHSDFNTGVHGVRFDCAMNVNIRDRRKITRMNGS